MDETTVVVAADGSVNNADESYARWHELGVKLLHRTLGKSVMVEKNTSILVKYMKKLGFVPEDMEEKSIL